MTIHFKYDNYYVPDTILGVEQPYSEGGENYTIPAVMGCTVFSQPLPKFICWSPNSPVPQNATVFADSISTEIN